MFLRLYTGVTTWWNDLKARAAEEGGATAVEYALMVALIAVVIIAAVAFIGKSASQPVQHRGRRGRRRELEHRATGPPAAQFPGGSCRGSEGPADEREARA